VEADISVVMTPVQADSQSTTQEAEERCCPGVCFKFASSLSTFHLHPQPLLALMLSLHTSGPSFLLCNIIVLIAHGDYNQVLSRSYARWRDPSVRSYDRKWEYIRHLTSRESRQSLQSCSVPQPCRHHGH
jgi:hypothetical protein